MKKLYLFVIALAMATNIIAQEAVPISGTVISEDDGMPMPGVTILEKGTTNGTVTDVNGKYSLSVNSKSNLLVFSYLGYESIEVSPDNSSVLNITLVPSLKILSEIVVTALGIERNKRALGYSVSDVSEDEIARNGEPNPISSIAGKVAGVNISSTTAGPTGSNRVVIRGIRELDGNNQPLYVIDGVPAVNGNIGSADQWGGFDLGDGLADLNPNNIESISVLKGASAAALYGSRALNGVILITTKKGEKRKGLGIELNSSLTIDKINTRLDERQTTYGQGSNGTLQRDATAASNITSNWGPRYAYADQVIQRDGTLRPYTYLDNNVQDFFRTGQTWMNSIAVSGGNEDASIRLAYNNITSTDIIPTSGFNRNTLDLYAGTKIAKGLSVSAKVAYNIEDVTNRPALTDDVNNIGNGLIGLAGNFDQAWLQNYMDEDGEYIDYTGNRYRANPYWTINKTRNESSKERINGYVNIDYQLNDMFSVNAKAGTDFYTFNHQNFYDKETPTFEGGVLQQLNQTMKESNFQGLINFKKALSSDFSVSALLGGNLMMQRSYGDQLQGSQIIEPGVINMVNFSELLIQPFDRKKEIQSLFATTELSFRNYLFLNLQARNDWASSLASPTNNNVSYFYPSADISFVLTDALEISSNVLSFGKVRASIGQVGSDTDPYGTTFVYSLTGRSMNGHSFGEILGNVIPNPNLRPQIKTSLEIGTDIRLWHDRVGLDITYYNETTEDAIIRIPVPQSAGFDRALLNAASLKNTGVEILLNTVPVRMSNGFRWDLSLNYSKNYNTVVSLFEGLELYPVEEARWAGATIVAREGEPFGTIMGAGFQRDDQGRIIHGADGFPKPTDTPVALGNSLPDWTGGIINSFSYKGFELKAAFDFKMGGDIFSITNMQMYQNGSHAGTEAGRDSFNEWQQERRALQDEGYTNEEIDAMVQQDGRGYIGDGVNEEGEMNDVPVNPASYWQSIGNNIPEPFIYDASHVKLRDLGISYTLTKSKFPNIPFEAITLGLIGRNLIILHKNTPNIDPESNYNNGNGQGFEYGSLPGRKRYGFNLNIKL